MKIRHHCNFVVESDDWGETDLDWFGAGCVGEDEYDDDGLWDDERS